MMFLSRYNLIAILFLTLFIFTACESEADKEAKKNACIDRVESSYNRDCNRACESDPVFFACSVETGGNVIGSGCPAWYKRMPLEKQISECKKETCNVYIPFEAVQHCYK